MAILIVSKESERLTVSTFRTEEELKSWKQEHISADLLLEMNPVSRGAIQQLERHFIRMLSEAYIIELQSNEEERKKILRLYEIGARR